MRISQLRPLDYRRAERLTPKERKIFTKKNRPFNEKCLALRYRSITKCSLEEAFHWARHNYKEFNTYQGKHWKTIRKLNNDKYLEKEFLFHGFVPKSLFQKEKGFNYIESNTPINGKPYIYPVKCTKGVSVPNWQDYPYLYDMQGKIGIPGYTKVDVEYSL